MLVDQRVGHDHGDVAATSGRPSSWRPPRPSRRRARPGSAPARSSGRGVADAHRGRRAQVGRGGRHHPVGELHDLGRDAVADRQPDRRATACGRAGGRARRPTSSGASGPVAWAMSPTTVSEPLSERRVAILQLHRREVLHLVDDDVAVRADLVARRRPCRPCRGVGPSTSRASSSSATSAGVQRTSSTSSARGRCSASSRRRRACRAPARRSSAGEPNRSCSSWAGVSTGHIRSSAARTSGIVAQRLARRRRPVTGSPRHDGGHRRRTPRPRRSGGRRCGDGSGGGPACTMRCVSSAREAQVAGAERHHEVLAQRALAVGDGLVDDVATCGRRP